MLIKWICETGYAKCNHEGEVEVDDNATESEIDEIVRDEALNFISWSWQKVGDATNEDSGNEAQHHDRATM